MEKVKTTITVTPEILDFLREMGGSPRKISIALEELVRDAVRRQNLTEAEIYRQIAELNAQLADIKEE